MTAMEHFSVHVETRQQFDNDIWTFGDRFYKIQRYDPETYNRLLQEYEDWVQRQYEFMREATKIANLVCDLVRHDVNPNARRNR